MDNAFISLPEAPVLVIGAAGQDLVGKLLHDLQPATSNPGRIRISFGGVARNVSENLARLGHPVTLLTAVGQDWTGEQLIKQIQGAGVDTSHILRTDKYPTGTYLALVDQKGWLQHALDDMRIISSLTPAYVEGLSGLFHESSLVFVDANLNKETLRKIFSLANKAKIPVCADPTSTLLASRLKPYLHRLKLITPNLAEAGILCHGTYDSAAPPDALETAKCLICQGVEIAIVAQAESGVCYATSETSGQVPALRTQVVDPTGGGDALTSAVIFAFLNGISIDDAVRLGVSAASLTLRYPGAVVPDLSLEKLYDRLVI